MGKCCRDYKGRFTRYDFCRMRERLTTGPRHDLRLLCTSEKCSIFKHVLKRCDNRKLCRRSVVSLSHETKIVPCKSALIMLSFQILFVGRTLSRQGTFISKLPIYVVILADKFLYLIELNALFLLSQNKGIQLIHSFV